MHDDPFYQPPVNPAVVGDTDSDDDDLHLVDGDGETMPFQTALTDVREAFDFEGIDGAQSVTGSGKDDCKCANCVERRKVLKKVLTPKLEYVKRNSLFGNMPDNRPADCFDKNSA